MLAIAAVRMSAIEGNLLQNSIILAGWAAKRGWTIGSIATTFEGGGFMITDTELRTASNGCGWRSTTEKLGQPPKVLRSSGEQHLILDATQAPQAEPVELEDALHVCEPHLDFLALAARLLEGFGVGEGADAVAHRLVDVSSDLAHRPGRALGL